MSRLHTFVARLLMTLGKALQRRPLRSRWFMIGVRIENTGLDFYPCTLTDEEIERLSVHYLNNSPLFTEGDLDYFREVLEEVD
jgi:hypothetical protein